MGYTHRIYFFKNHDQGPSNHIKIKKIGYVVNWKLQLIKWQPTIGHHNYCKLRSRHKKVICSKEDTSTSRMHRLLVVGATKATRNYN